MSETPANTPASNEETAAVVAPQAGPVSQWLQQHQTLKPGNKMPAHDDIDKDTLDALGAWLETLTP